MQNIAEIEISYSPKLKTSELITVSSSDQAYEVLSPEWKDLRRIESFKILLLNQANKVLGISIVSKGGVSGTVADARNIFQVALKANASSVILAHNHPSGNMKASQQDILLTKKIKEGGKLLDIAVLDHLIVTDIGFSSLADDGNM
jgi:DNA repair protein RadC